VCFAWALLTNHVHSLSHPGLSGLAAFMRRLLTGHAIDEYVAGFATRVAEKLIEG